MTAILMLADLPSDLCLLTTNHHHDCANRITAHRATRALPIVVATASASRGEHQCCKRGPGTCSDIPRVERLPVDGMNENQAHHGEQQAHAEPDAADGKASVASIAATVGSCRVPQHAELAPARRHQRRTTTTGRRVR